MNKSEPMQDNGKLFRFEHRHGDFDPSYHRLYSPSGLSLCLTHCDKDTGAFLEEANMAIRELASKDATIASLNAHFNAGQECERRDCEKALTALAGAHICTPAETYGTNSSWAISDLCRAVTSQAATIASLREELEWQQKVNAGRLAINERQSEDIEQFELVVAQLREELSKHCPGMATEIIDGYL